MKSQSYFIPERTRLEALFHRGGVLASPALLKRAAAHVTLVSPKTVHASSHVSKAAREQMELSLYLPPHCEGIAQQMAQAYCAKALSVFDEEGLLLSEYPQGGSLQRRLQSMHCLWPSDWKSLVVETAANEFLYWVAGGHLRTWLVGLLVSQRLAAEQVEALRLELCALQGEPV